MPDRFTPIQPNTDQTQQISIINNNFAQLDQEGVKKLYKDSNGNNRIFLDGTTGIIKVAKDGFDVTTATDAQLAFNSNQNTLKVVSSGTVTLPTNLFFKTTANTYGSGSPLDGWPVSVTIPHNLGYVPIVLAYAGEVESGLKPIPLTRIWANGPDYFLQYTYEAYCDATNLYISVQAFGYNSPGFSASGIDWQSEPVSYYLLQESANAA